MSYDLTNKKFGRLTVLIRNGIKDGQYFWKCKCDCGKEVSVRSRDIRKGKTISCGCWNNEKRIKHGKYKTPEYGIYQNMKSRCIHKSNIMYHRYGGRGITVCDRWLESFENFLEDMGKRPSHIHSIDRINNDGNYEPSNCRWATKLEQDNNRSTCIKLISNGEEHTISEWARKLNTVGETIRCRLKRGWSIDEAVNTPIGMKPKKYKKQTDIA